MSDAITKELVVILMKKVQKEIDIDAMAKSLAPKIQKALEVEVLQMIRDGDILCDMDFTELTSIVEQAMEKAAAAMLGIKKKKKK